MKKILSLILVICILMMPFKIFADSQTYYTNTVSNPLYTHSSSSYDYYSYVDDGSKLTVIQTSQTIVQIYIVSTESSKKIYSYAVDKQTGIANSTSEHYNSSSTVLNGVRYYYYGWNAYSLNDYNWNITINPNSQNDSVKSAIYYTYGDGAVEPEPVQSWGLLNIRFNTNISTHDAGDNQDNISWTSWDSNGNYIGDKQIEIRAVPGYYEAQDKPSLLQLKFINWVRESNLEVQVYKGSVVPEHKTYTWNYIAGLFSSIKTWQGRFWSIFASDDYWYQYGWIYEARILDTDDTPLSEWQEIVTGTASSPNDTEIIETSDELTPELYNVIYNINVYNDYQENWQINNTTINMQPDETLDNDKPWWVVLLEGILSILDKLLELLMKLFIPENLTLPDFTNQTNQYMNNTGIFGQSIQFINDTHNTFQSIQNADPVISVPAITYDNTTLIPAQSWNLNTLVNDYGLSDLHNMVYLVTDGFVYIGLIILIRRKVIEVLKK